MKPKTKPKPKPNPKPNPKPKPKPKPRCRHPSGDEQGSDTPRRSCPARLPYTAGLFDF